jgi:iron(III) transport system ATP-binding protein
MTTIRLENVTKNFGATRAVDQVSLTIAAGELFFLLGPSGCGKTTLLRMLAGFVEPDAGAVYFDAQAMTGVPPRRRGTGMVFQSYALWPHRTVAGNVAYGLEVRGLARAEINRKVQDALKLVRLEGLEQRRPAARGAGPGAGHPAAGALARRAAVQPRRPAPRRDA